MPNAIIKLRALLDSDDAVRLIKLLGIIALMAILEVAGIASILPFLTLATSPEAITDNQWVAWAYQTAGFDSHRQMLIASGCCVIGLLTMSDLLAIASIWQRQKLAWQIAHSISMKLVRAYAELPYQFFLENDSADLIKKIVNDVQGLVNGVFLAGSQVLCQLLVSFTILCMLLLVDFWIAITAFLLFAGIYLVVFLLRRSYVAGLGKEQLDANRVRYKTFAELITGIKTIKSEGVKSFFVDRFEKGSDRFTLVHPKLAFIAAMPRYIIEIISFGGVVLLTLYLVITSNDFINIIPTLAIFALAGYRLLPAVNTAYGSMTQVISSFPAIEAIYQDIHAVADAPSPETKEIAFKESIRLDGLSFRYRPDAPLVVDDVTLSISKGTKVAFVGPTGSGKTTLIDNLMGLLIPQDGTLSVDGVVIDETTRASWQRMIGYVPQEVFLYDDTIARNVAFGAEKVDRDRVEEVCRTAQLSGFVEELGEKYETKIGERGVRLSGGQRQRLGLARALYRHPQVLLLDEATSALDNVTERHVVDAIHGQLPGVTIIMIAHRISTVRKCDRLYMIDRGKLVAEGNYEELLSSSDLFAELARFS